MHACLPLLQPSDFPAIARKKLETVQVCYMAAQLAGPEGRVIGVDMNDDMLALARRYQAEMAEKLGGDRVRFVSGNPRRRRPRFSARRAHRRVLLNRCAAHQMSAQALPPKDGGRRCIACVAWVRCVKARILRKQACHGSFQLRWLT